MIFQDAHREEGDHVRGYQKDPQSKNKIVKNATKVTKSKNRASS